MAQRWMYGRVYLFALLMGGFLMHCANLSDVLKQLDIQKPQVAVKDARLTSLSFDHVDLLFDVNINNPNSVGITMAGFDYELLINDNSFVKGDKQDRIEVKANGENRFDFPVSLQFSDLFQSIKSMIEQDSSGYQMKFGLLFDLPVLGKTKIPVSHSGSLPVPKLPGITVEDLKVKQLSLTGADLELKIGLTNPNGFGLDFNQFTYQLAINGQNWVTGISDRSLSINKKGQNTITVPVALDFLAIGRSVAQLLTSPQDLSYTLTGDVNLKSTAGILDVTKVPFTKSGKIALTR